MTIGFVINSIASEKEVDTTPFLAYQAQKMGHRVFMIDVMHMNHSVEGKMGALAILPHDKNFRSTKTFLEGLKSDDVKTEQITSSDMDVLFLRSNPSELSNGEQWAQATGIRFGHAAEKDGVLVLNHPPTMYHAIVDKLYFEQYPKEVKPFSIITRDPKEIKAFYEEYKKIVLKPLLGSGGKDVFLLDDAAPNMNQIIEVIGRSGYVIAQEFLTAADKGDMRVFLMNGKILEINGRAAAMKRTNPSDDFRHNVHAGGTASKTDIDDRVREIAEIIRPKIIKDGIFLAGLDIIGDKIVEINILSPGGIKQASEFEKLNFGEKVIQAIEHKVMLKKLYPHKFNNRQLAVI